MVTSCTKLKSKRRNTSGSFLITTSENNQIKDLKNNAEMDRIKILWEDYVRKNPITQCYNCQQLGHGCNNCGKTPRCLKCAQNHITKECPIKERSEENRSKLKCANCGGPHPANYRNCPVIQEHTNKMLTSKNTQLNKIKNSNNKFNVYNNNFFITQLFRDKIHKQ